MLFSNENHVNPYDKLESSKYKRSNCGNVISRFVFNIQISTIKANLMSNNLMDLSSAENYHDSRNLLEG